MYRSGVAACLYAASTSCAARDGLLISIRSASDLIRSNSTECSRSVVFLFSVRRTPAKVMMPIKSTVRMAVGL